MKTPWISLQASPQRLEYYAPNGQQRRLDVAKDGRLEGELSTGLPDAFVSSLDDARLHVAQPGAGSLGPGWTYTYGGGEKLRLGSPEGPHQEVVFQGNEVVVTTFAQGVEHCMSGRSQNGALQPESVTEKAQLEVSPAGLNVLCDGKVLFEMPSAFGGGCTW